MDQPASEATWWLYEEAFPLPSPSGQGESRNNGYCETPDPVHICSEG